MTSRSLPALCLLLLTASVPAWACTCSQAPPGKCPGLQPDDTIFLGTVTDVEGVPSPAAASPSAAGTTPITRYRFQVDQRFAGANGPTMDVFSGGDDGDCGYHFQKGEQYLVFTQREGDNRLFATTCNGTRPAADALAIVPQLRAMSRGERIASVFGLLRRTDPPFLSPPDDPDDPLGNITLHLRSQDDRFETATDTHGVYSFYDVHGGTYKFSAQLPARMELSEKTLPGALPPFQIPDDACYEYDVDALPTGHLRGSVVGPKGKPLPLASVELYRLGSYADGRPGLWGYQGSKGYFDFDHVGPGAYVIVFNRPDRLDPNAPFARTFYPGVDSLDMAKPIVLKDGQRLMKLRLKLSHPYPTRQIRVRVKWVGGRPAGSLTMLAAADHGDNPAAQKIAPGLYEFTVLKSARYTISAYEDLDPQRAPTRRGQAICEMPARIEAPSVEISGADAAVKEVLLTFTCPSCGAGAP